MQVERELRKLMKSAPMRAETVLPLKPSEGFDALEHEQPAPTTDELLITLLNKIDALDRKVDRIFGAHILYRGQFITLPELLGLKT